MTTFSAFKFAHRSLRKDISFVEDENSHNIILRVERWFNDRGNIFPFVFVKKYGNLINLTRLKPFVCFKCKVQHTNVDAFIAVNPDGKIFFNCKGGPGDNSTCCKGMNLEIRKMREESNPFGGSRTNEEKDYIADFIKSVDCKDSVSEPPPYSDCSSDPPPYSIDVLDTTTPSLPSSNFGLPISSFPLPGSVPPGSGFGLPVSVPSSNFGLPSSLPGSGFGLPVSVSSNNNFELPVSVLPVNNSSLPGSVSCVTLSISSCSSSVISVSGEADCKVCKLTLSRECIVQNTCRQCMESREFLSDRDNIFEYATLLGRLQAQKFAIDKVKLLARIYRDLHCNIVCSNPSQEYSEFKEWAVSQGTTPIQTRIVSYILTDMYMRLL